MKPVRREQLMSIVFLVQTNMNQIITCNLFFTSNSNFLSLCGPLSSIIKVAKDVNIIYSMYYYIHSLVCS